jgi:hypothetical protein
MREAPRTDEIAVERHLYRALVLYDVTGDELDQLESERLTLSQDFSFAAVGLSVGVSFLIGITTTTITLDRLFQSFFVVTLVGFVGAAFFGIRWLRGRSKFRSVIQRIRDRAEPLGQEGKEVQQGEQGALPKQVPPTGLQ